MIRNLRTVFTTWLGLMLCAAGSAGAQDAASTGAYKLDPSGSTLSFEFIQAGAKSTGRFEKFDVELVLAEGEDAKLDVTVDVASLNTEDAERDGLLRDADLFNTAKFPRARFISNAITRTGEGRYEASGQLTIRDVTRDVRIPFAFTTTAQSGKTVGVMTGQFVIKRLDYGVGQGEWKSTEWVANDVTVSFDLRLLPGG